MIEDILKLLLNSKNNIEAAVDTVNTVTSNYSKNSGSLSRIVDTAVLQFPIIASSSLDIDTLSTLSRAHELNAAALLKIAFQLNPNTTKTKSIEKYIKTIHTNNPITAINTKNYMISIESDVHLLKDPVVMNRSQLYPYYDTIRKTPIGVTESTSSNKDKSNNSDSKKYDIKSILVDADVKKANELMPTIISVDVSFFDKNSTEGKSKTILLGVKSVLHPVGPNEIIDNFNRTMERRSTFFNFIRWTTGEIKFFKDFMLNIDNVRNDVVDQSIGKSPMWNVLKRMKSKAAIAKAFRIGSGPLPNSTIILSTDEAMILKDMHNIDISDPNTCQTLMDRFFLLCIQVVDPITRIVEIQYDGRPKEHYTLDSLERKNENENKKIKEILSNLRRNY